MPKIVSLHAITSPLVDLVPCEQFWSDLTYVVLTSGSTGKQNGVGIPLKGVGNTCCDTDERFDIGTGDAVLIPTTLSSDLPVFDLLGVLLGNGVPRSPSPCPGDGSCVVGGADTSSHIISEASEGHPSSIDPKAGHGRPVPVRTPKL